MAAVCFAATLLLPATLTARLDWEGFSGRFVRETAEARAKLIARFPGTATYSYEGSLRDGPRILDWAWNDSRRPLLIFWIYANELPTARELRRLSADFAVTEVAFLPGLFSDLATPSGLRNCFPCSTQVFLITAARHPPAAAARVPP